jgi:hypothetical protein
MNFNPDEKAAKQALYGVLKDLEAKNWQGRDAQPWLRPQQSYRRPDSVAAKQGKRADQNGNVRNLKASDLGVVVECERRFGAAYEGITLQHSKPVPLYEGKSGTLFHSHMEAHLPQWIETERSARNNMFVKLPSIGQKTEQEYTGKKSGITGMMDGYLVPYQTGLEIKSVAYGMDWPGDDVPKKALGQAAGYAWGLNRMNNPKNPLRWFWLYLPQDMRTFRANDLTTYRFFSKTTEELEPIFEDILERAIRVASIIDANGYYNSWDLLACYEGDTCYCSN